MAVLDADRGCLQAWTGQVSLGLQRPTTAQLTCVYNIRSICQSGVASRHEAEAAQSQAYVASFRTQAQYIWYDGSGHDA